MKSIRELKGLYSGGDAWIIAAGKSMDFIDPEFFRGKQTIGVNRVYRNFPCRYVVQKDPQIVELPAGSELVVCEYQYGEYKFGRLEVPGPHYRFEHLDSRWVMDDEAMSVVGTDRLVVSLSTITTAIHLAAYMGAANIILCGHDGGTIDGESYYDGYYTPEEIAEYKSIHHDSFLAKIKPQTRRLRDRLREVYGCRVYSLNPFISLGLDGHKFVDFEDGSEQEEKPKEGGDTQ